MEAADRDFDQAMLKMSDCHHGAVTVIAGEMNLGRLSG